MNYTRGERKLYCGDDYWVVEIRDKPIHPSITIGKFQTKEDALLDIAAPGLYEACKIALDLVTTVLYEHPDDEIAKAQKEAINKALSKAEGRK